MQTGLKNTDSIRAHLEPEIDFSFSEDISTQIKEDYAMMPKLVFTLGRLAEGSQKYADAEKYYNQITEEYPDSNYSLYGQDRIILMKAKGQI